MRSIVMVALALCPILVHAQTASPKPAVLESRLVAPAPPAAAAAAGTPIRISTGVTLAKLLQTVPLQESFAWTWAADETEKVAVVHLVVEPNGTPSHIALAHSLSPQMDQDIIASVSRYQFAPARLNGQNVPLDMDLTVRIRNRHQ